MIVVAGRCDIAQVQIPTGRHALDFKMFDVTVKAFKSCTCERWKTLGSLADAKYILIGFSDCGKTWRCKHVALETLRKKMGAFDKLYVDTKDLLQVGHAHFASVFRV